MATKALNAAPSEPRHARPSEELAAIAAEIRTGLRTKREQLEKLNRASRVGRTDDELSGMAGDTALLEEQIKRDEGELHETESELKRARTREDQEAAATFAATAGDTLLQHLQAAETARAAADLAASELLRDAERLFDREVRSRLTSDPTKGIRARILQVCPGAHRLAELDRQGWSLLQNTRQWPKLVLGPDGGAHFDGLELIQSAEDFRGWRAQERLAVPGGTRAAQQLADLMTQFGR